MGFGPNSRMGWRKPAVVAVAAVALLCCVLFIFPPRGDIPLYRDDAKSRASVLSRVPIGSEAVVARQRMEEDGFKCRLLEERESRGHDLLRCEKDRFIPITEWVVSFHVNNGLVSEVVVVYGTTFM